MISAPANTSPSAAPDRTLPGWLVGSGNQSRCLRTGWVAALGSLLLLAGCSIDHPLDLVSGPAYVPANVHRDSTNLPAEMRRVALLPLASSLDDTTDTAARETLETVLQQELAKTKRFEVVLVSPDRLMQHTGRSRWKADDVLPPSFFSRLAAAYGCEGVMFTQITVFRAYPPLAIGWRCKLVSTNGVATPWTADEVFDAGQPAVVNGARRYQQGQQEPGGPLDDSRAILSSPRRFGHYSAGTLLATLPKP